MVVRLLCRAFEAGCACERVPIGAVGRVLCTAFGAVVRVLCTAFEAVCVCERVSIGAVVLVLCTAFRSMGVALGSMSIMVLLRVGRTPENLAATSRSMAAARRAKWSSGCGKR